MKRFDEELRSSPRGSDWQGDPGPSSQSPPTAPFPHGIQVWHDCPNATVDICFVHGLTGDRESTWTVPGQSAPWPKTLLAAEMSQARILTYGYDVYVVRMSTPSTDRLIHHASNLLTDLTTDRIHSGAFWRPLFFVAHSVGGLVCKKAILLSRNHPESHLRGIFNCTRGIVFMGTPHRGPWMTHWANIPASAIGLVTSAYMSLLEVLETNTQLLEDTQVKFWQLMGEQREDGRRLKVMCFFETRLLPVVGVIVSKESATLKGYASLSIHANHRDMAQLVSVDNAFRRLLGELIMWESQTAPKSLDKEQKQVLMDSLRFDQIDTRRKSIKQPYNNTCRWLLKRPEYLDWLDHGKLAEHDGFLWIKGLPGAGKSTLMKFALEDARENMKDKIIISFFFNARGDYLERSITGMYRSLLLQLLEQHPEPQSVFDSFELATSNRSPRQWDAQLLEALFEQAVLRLGKSSLVCFIDALNECPQPLTQNVILFFEQVGKGATSTGVAFRVCFSTRHYPNILFLKGLSLILEEQEEHNQDIVSYINNKLRIGDSDLAKSIRDEVKQKASGVFLWVALVVEFLQSDYGQGAAIHELQKRLRVIPGNIRGLFHVILTRGHHDKRELLCILWVLFARQPLKPEQLFFAILSGIKSVALSEWKPDEITNSIIDRFIFLSSRGLVEVIRSNTPTVRFIHESVRDFLLRENGLMEIWPDPTENLEGESHELLKSCCVEYMNVAIADLKLDVPLPRASSQQVAEARQSVDKAYPFLEYAVRNVLGHADRAESYGVSQMSFIQHFQLSNWIKLDNLFAKRDIQRHTPKASLLYILAEHNLASLIRQHSDNLSCFEIEDERYGMPIFAALATNSREAVQALVKSQAGSRSPTSLLHSLCEKYYRDENNRVNIRRDFQFPRRQYLLSYLAKLGEEIILAFVLASGKYNAEINSKGEDDQTPLSWAAKRGHEAVVRILLDHGAIIEARDNNSQTPLLWAAKRGREAVVRILLDHGAIIEARDNNSQTPLLWAAKRGHEAIVRLLLEKGAAIETADKDSKTPLLWAVESGHEVIVQLLLDYGANIEATDKDSRTPISYAAELGHEAIVRILLDHGAVIKARDNNSQPPLLLAAERGNEAIARLLLEEDGATEAPDKEDRTPTHPRTDIELPSSQAIQTGPCADSGYATATCCESEHAQNAGAGNDEQCTGDNQAWPPTDDARTIYSDAPSLPAVKRDLYVSELANNLFSIVKSEQLDDLTKERVSKVLPERLKAFALRIGHNARTQVNRDIMVFVHKHRYDIVKDFKTKYSDQEKSIADDQACVLNMPLNELMNNWFQTWDADDNESLHNAQTHDCDKIPLDDIRINEHENLDAQYDFALEDEESAESANMPAFHTYRNVILESPAYEWLLGSLRKEFLLAPAEEALVEGDSMEAIRKKITDSLPSSHKISRTSSSESYKATFEVDWDPLAFVEEQQYGEAHKIIDITITLTGCHKDAQALTCAQYLRQTWPSTGELIMRLVTDVLRSGPGYRQECELPDGTKLAAWLHLSKFEVEACGIAASIAEIGEQFAWLGAALRSSPYKLSIAYCTPCITVVRINNALQQVPGTPPPPDILCKINFTMKELKDSPEPSNGQCWHGLFRNPVLIAGFPILRRSNSGTGLEIPLDLMAKLIQARRVTCFDGNLFIKSSSAILFPTRRVGDCIVWHLLFDYTNHISYIDPRIPHFLDQNQAKVAMSDLPMSRHILGWSSNVKSYAGAPDATYTIDWAGLEKPNESSPLRKVIVKRGKLIPDSTTAIGEKDMPIFLRPGGDYISMLKWFETRFIHLFDTKDRRSWLIDGPSAILHLVRASLAHDKDGNFKHLMLVEPNDIEDDPAASNRKASAIAALTNESNMRLELYVDEIMQQGHDSSQHTAQKKYFRLKDRIEQIFHILEQILIYQDRLLSADGGPRGQLEGFNFMDLAADEDYFHPRATTLTPEGKGWVDFLRAIRAPTLFGEGFGEILKPVDSPREFCHWAELPKRKDYLAVCVSDLKYISRKKGSGAHNLYRLTEEIHWHKPDKAFETCGCEDQKNHHGAHADRVQVLIPRHTHALWGDDFRPPGELEDAGAVIFGYSETCPLHWGEYGNPTKTDHLSHYKEPQGPPSSDSGIGSSLSSSSREENQSRSSKELSSCEAPPSNPKQSQQKPATVLKRRPNNRDRETAFRVTGIPNTFEICHLRCALETHPSLQLEPGAKMSVKSMTAEANNSSQVATISFDRIPRTLSAGNSWNLALKSEKEVDLNALDTVKRITIDNHFNGLTILHAPKRDHNVDIILISGLGGHAYGSFKERGGDYMWALDSLPYEIPTARIIIYGHESRLANSTSFHCLGDLGYSLQNRLRSFYMTYNGPQPCTRPIIFIGHSLGGLLVKEAIIKISETEEGGVSRFLQHVYGAMFFGVPNNGLDIASFKPAVGNGPNRLFVESLNQDNSPILEEQRKKFKAAFNFEDSEIHAFYEMRASSTMRIGRDMIYSLDGEEKVLVSKTSATQCRSKDQYMYPLDYDHSGLVKFSPNDEDYNTVLHCLKGMIQRATSSRRCGVTAKYVESDTRKVSGAPETQLEINRTRHKRPTSVEPEQANSRKRNCRD